MKKIYVLIFMMLLGSSLKAQTICNSGGNVILFSNYDGGVLNINVDVNIPNLKIGVVSYEMVTINLMGPFAGNVTEVRFAGYTTTTHQHCTNTPPVTSIVGAPPGTDTLVFMPPSPLINPNGYYIIICNTSCDTSSNQGGCNTADQVAAYFLQEFGGALRFHKTQYGCWTTTQNISAGGNCCVGAVTSPLAPVASIQSSDTSFCDKKCLDFFDLSTNNPTSWQWFFPGADSTTSTMQNPTGICYNSYGSFDVTLIACNAAGCDTLVLPGFINEYALPVPLITQSNDTLFSSSGVTYQWWNVATGIIAGATNSYYLPITGGDYYVIVTDSVGCAGSSNVITSSFAGINQFSVGSGQLAISPNPNDGSFTVILNVFNGKDFSLRIINPLGQIIYEKQETKGQGRLMANLNLGDFAKGIYTVMLITNETVVRKQFVIK